MPDYTKPPYIKYTRSDQPNNDIYTTPDILSAPATPGFNNGLTNEQMLKNSGWIPATSSNPSTTPNPTQTSPSVSELAKNSNFAFRSDPMLDQLKQDANKTIDEEAIRQQEMDRIQEQINAIRGVYANEIAAANREGEGRLGSQRAISARSGLIGSDFGEAQKTKVEGYNRDVVNGINSRMSADIAAIFQKAQDRASERIKLETDQKRMDRDEYLKRLDQLTADSRKDLATIAASGVNYDELDDATKQLLANNSGYGAATKQIYNKLASEDLVDKLTKTASLGLQVPPEDKNVLDSIYGQGFSDKFVQVQKTTAQAKTDAEKYKAATDLVDILSKLPAGKKYNINGTEYEGIKETNNNQIFSETSPNGMVSFVTVDKGTGKIVNVASGGNIGKGFKGLSGGSGGGNVNTSISSGQNTVIGKNLDKLLVNYPADFKAYIKGISPSVQFPLTPQNIASQYQQFANLKGKGIGAFDTKVKTINSNTDTNLF